MVKTFEAHQYWAVILGGSSGLGLAAARKLAAQGMHICIVYRNSRTEEAEIAREFEGIREMGVQLLTFNADAGREEKRADLITALAAALQGKGKVRCLLHSIAKGNLKAMVPDEGNALATDDFRITYDHMAVSLYSWTKDLLAQQLFAADARVLAFTSEGSHRAWKHYAAVSAAKAALEAIVRSIALEMAPFGIRANSIQAGITDTRSLRMIPGSEQLIAYSKSRNPFQRLTTPEDVANVVYLLCKDEAAWINGAVIPADGGTHIS
ncbi:SDR family oxidoreductase [Chitinophaga nivalis]|uniref:SDR family oxidoreductase n=1 Tax=Chitinophaga nivalis TaxID=2991709 RepID=A0ABT3II05_9BACT|nr:SDR family oxidoreductase [Chitinophaga nivalis]MCW3466748.1 SDR family oxidoreductase [Chitinophaga nivalis]MCW3483561.1 SDR family oxidoreductase [Chitinophaga nivalis]